MNFCFYKITFQVKLILVILIFSAKHIKFPLQQRPFLDILHLFKVEVILVAPINGSRGTSTANIIRDDGRNQLLEESVCPSLGYNQC